MDLKNKVAIVTGGVSGIGAAIVKELLKNDLKHVAILDLDLVKGKIFVDNLNNVYGTDRVILIHTDVTNDRNFEDAFKETITKCSRLDIIINNAGIVSKDYQKMIDINLTAVIRGTNLGIKYLSKINGGNGGIILNMSSMSCFVKYSLEPAYAATKAGVTLFTQSYGTQFHEEHGITFLAICPSYTETNIFNFDFTQKEKEEFDRHMKVILLQKPETVAKATVYAMKVGKNGEVFIVKDEKLYLANIPPVLKELVLEEL